MQKSVNLFFWPAFLLTFAADKSSNSFPIRFFQKEHSYTTKQSKESYRIRTRVVNLINIHIITPKKQVNYEKV